MRTATEKSLGASSTGEPLAGKRARRSDGVAHTGRQTLPTSSRLDRSPFFPLRPGDTVNIAGDTDRYLLNATAMLKESFDLLADAHMGFVGRGGVRLGHVGISVMSH